MPMNPLFFYNYINLTLFAILGNFRAISSAAVLPSAKSISLYNATDKIIVFDNGNFSSTVYHSDTAWLIEFYASWCGHCQTYANTYREVGIDTWAWRTIVRIGAVNCFSPLNTPICREQGVRGYPALRLIPPDAVFDNTSKGITIPPADAKDVEKELIQGLEKMKKGNRTWPRFIPVNRMTLEELCLGVPKSIKLLLLIVENRDDLTGRQVMLDFSKYRDQIAVFRTTTDGPLWRRLHLNITDIPSLFVILPNRTATRLDTKRNSTTKLGNRNLFNYAIRTYIHRSKQLTNFDNDDLKETMHEKNALKSAQAKQQLDQKNNNKSDEIRDRDTVHQKVNLVDLELALSYMFRQEISQIGKIQGGAYRALLQWLTVLIKYFPGRKPVMDYLHYVLSKVKDHSKDLNGNRFREIVDMKTSNAYLPNSNEQYQHCAGSAPQYRGYPCALWLLFHTLTVSQYHLAASDSSPVAVTEVPMAVQNYIKYFFTCRKCSENFMNETKDIRQLNRTNKYEAILYLWNVHNHVNLRLRNDITEDPKHPKVQFPSIYLCETCQLKNGNEYDYFKTVNFLLKYYSKENLDTFALTNKSYPNEDVSNGPERVISRIDYTNQSGFFFRISEEVPIYIFVALLILIIFIRRRCCRMKGARYTL